MPTWIIPPLAAWSSLGCWRRKGIGWHTWAPAGLAQRGAVSGHGEAPAGGDDLRRKFGLHGGPLHGGEKAAEAGCLLPGNRSGLRPDRATIVYANRVREAFGAIPLIIGGLEASLRRFAHYDYWSDQVRRSILFDARADLLTYGMGEAATLEIAARLRAGTRSAKSPACGGPAMGRGMCPDVPIRR